MAAPKSAKTSTSKRKTVDDRTRTAFHEAGHAVLSAAIGDTPQHVSIRAQGHTLGRSGARRSPRPTSHVQVLLAGFASEHLLTGRRPRQLEQEVGFAIVARGDQALAAAFAGSDEQDGHRAVHGVLSMGAEDGDDEIKREVDRYYEIARESLSSIWLAVVAVAKALLKHEELDRDGIDEAIGDIDIFGPVFALQRQHGLLPGATVTFPAKAPIPKPAAKAPKRTASTPGEDHRLDALLEAFKADPKLAPIVDVFEASAKSATGRKFGSNGLKVNGKLFALFTQGTLVVKLPRVRVAALVDQRVGKPFDPGHGRLMKEWLATTSAKGSWIDLAKEAHDFVKGARR